MLNRDSWFRTRTKGRRSCWRKGRRWRKASKKRKRDSKDWKGKRSRGNGWHMKIMMSRKKILRIHKANWKFEIYSYAWSIFTLLIVDNLNKNYSPKYPSYYAQTEDRFSNFITKSAGYSVVAVWPTFSTWAVLGCWHNLKLVAKFKQ